MEKGVKDEVVVCMGDTELAADQVGGVVGDAAEEKVLCVMLV